MFEVSQLNSTRKRWQAGGNYVVVTFLLALLFLRPNSVFGQAEVQKWNDFLASPGVFHVLDDYQPIDVASIRGHAYATASIAKALVSKIETDLVEKELKRWQMESKAKGADNSVALGSKPAEFQMPEEEQLQPLRLGCRALFVLTCCEYKALVSAQGERPTEQVGSVASAKDPDTESKNPAPFAAVKEAAWRVQAVSQQLQRIMNTVDVTYFDNAAMPDWQQAFLLMNAMNAEAQRHYQMPNETTAEKLRKFSLAEFSATNVSDSGPNFQLMNALPGYFLQAANLAKRAAASRVQAAMTMRFIFGEPAQKNREALSDVLVESEKNSVFPSDLRPAADSKSDWQEVKDLIEMVGAFQDYAGVAGDFRELKLALFKDAANKTDLLSQLNKETPTYPVPDVLKNSYGLDEIVNRLNELRSLVQKKLPAEQVVHPFEIDANGNASWHDLPTPSSDKRTSELSIQLDALIKKASMWLKKNSDGKWQHSSEPSPLIDILPKKDQEALRTLSMNLFSESKEKADEYLNRKIKQYVTDALKTQKQFDTFGNPPVEAQAKVPFEGDK